MSQPAWAAIVYTYHHHLVLISPKADTYFTILKAEQVGKPWCNRESPSIFF